MKKLVSALAGAAFLACAVPAFADPSGSYSVKGVNPDGTNYEASVLVAKVGDTYTLTYTLDDGAKAHGTAIGDDDLLSIGYGQEGDIGVALMMRKGKDWEGVWTYLGAKNIGTETWQPE